MTKTAIFTICAKNYAAYARTLYESVRRIGETSDFFWIISDELGADDIEPPDGMQTIEAKNIAPSGFADMAFRYDITELSTAIKPTCILALLGRGYEYVIYLDPDIYVTSQFDEIYDALNGGASAVLTPHISAPLEDGKHPDDLQILRAGIFNLGFAAFADKPESRSFLEWWARRLERDCRIDMEAGLFVDQKFVDLAPSFIDDLKILKHSGYNIAYWNLAQREVTKTVNDEWRANGQPVRFFHFSGVIPDDPTVYSKHQNRYDTDNIGVLNDALQQYISALNANGYRETKSLAYAYDYYASGAKLPSLVRKAYARSAPRNEALTLNEAFDKNGRINQFLTAPAAGNASPLSRLEAEALELRPDLAAAFAMRPAKAFQTWFYQHGAEAFDLPDTFVANGGANATSLGANIAGKILNARAILRPLYRRLPLGLRATVKRNLLRSHTGGVEDTVTPTAATGAFNRDSRPGVQQYGFFESASGIGQSARGTAMALQAANIPFATTTLRNPNDNRETEPFQPKSPPSGGFRIALLHLNAEQLLRIGELTPAQRLDGQYRIGVWAWELAKFPAEWKTAFDYVDEIWAPSTFVAKAIGRETEKPVHIVPHIINVAHNTSPLAEECLAIEGRTSFLTAFDAKSFIGRKNPQAAIAAFKKAFPENSPTGPVLLLKANGVVDDQADLGELFELIAGANNIWLITRPMSRDEFLSLMAATDCFISLHRSEGFGLNIAEAMALGKPVIATNYSGETDFLDAVVGAPVPFDLLPLREGDYPFAAGQFWAEPQVQEAAAAIRNFAASPELRRRIGAAGAKRIKENYSAKAIGEKILTRLRQIDPELRSSR